MGFLEESMLRLSFSHSWVKLVMCCVRTVSFSMIINGKSGATFCPQCGLAKGILFPHTFSFW